MRKSLASGKLKSSLFSFSDVITTPVMMLLLMPILLTNLGVVDYALWVLVNSIIASIALFNFAGTDVVLRFVALEQASDKDTDSKNQAIGEITSTVFLVQLSVFGGLLLLLCALYGLLKNLPFNTNGILIILLLAAPMFCFKQFEQLLYAFCKAFEDYRRFAMLSILSKLTFYAVQGIAACWLQEVIWVFGFALVNSLVLFAIQLYWLKSRYPMLQLVSRFSRQRLYLLRDFASWNWFSSLASMLTVHMDKWLVSGLMGLAVFGYYAIGVLVFNQLYTVLSASLNWVFPKVTKQQLTADNQHAMVKDYYLQLLLTISLGFIVSFSLSELTVVFKLWLGNESFPQAWYYIELFLLIFPLYVMSVIPYYYLLAKGLVRQKFIIDVLGLSIKTAILLAVLSLFSQQDWVLGLVIFFVFEVLAYHWVLRRKIGIHWNLIALLCVGQIGVIIGRWLHL